MRIRNLPTTVQIICGEYGGWIVGSAADPGAVISRVKDIDVIVPFHQWRRVSKIAAAKRGASLNKHGGSRFVEDGTQIDVWPDTLDNNMVTCITQWVWHPRSGIRFQRQIVQ